MKKIILRSLYTGAVASLILTAILVFCMQFTIQTSTAKSTAQVRISDSKIRIEESETEIAELKASLDAEYIAAANSFAEMIALNPNVITDADELERIRKMLDVDELHVTDEKGVIQWGTIPGYFGFDFAGSEQTKPFLPILEDPSLEMAQEPQPNGTEGKLFQYISVGRKDKTGIVQVGLEPIRLTEALADSQIDVVLKDVAVGATGTMFAVNKTDNTLSAFHDAAYIGTPAADIGFTEKILTIKPGGGKYAAINGKLYYVTMDQTDEYYLGALSPVADITGATVSTTILTVILTAVVIGLLVFLVNKAVTKHIISGITEVCRNVESITAGNTELRLDTRSCKEFSILSDGINSMLDSINAKMDESGQLNRSMEGLLGRIGNISTSINDYAKEMEDVSRKIADGSASQAATVEELSATFSAITNDVNENAKAARNAADITVETVRQLNASTEKINRMQDSMEQISTVSNKINNIVKTIDDIAFQTNILALNAAVEAARAGQHGKGFAVVADEVRNLANKSAEAAKGTTELISETLLAVEHGAQVANSAAQELSGMLDSVKNSTRIIEEISEATTKQANAIGEASSGITQISDVVQKNSAISFSARETAGKLDDEAGKLMSLVRSK